MIKDALFLLCGALWSPLGNRASILMYHSVADNGAFFTVTPSKFGRQMHALKKSGHTVVSLEELCRRLKAGESVASLVAITFDDGYRDNYTVAFPILKQYGFPATIFVTTGAIGSTDKRGLERLSEEDMKEMEASGLVDIEPHTVSHPKLAQLSRADAESEVRSSKTVLENMLSKKCTLFAYPYGSFNDETVAIVEEAGLNAAVTVKESTVGSGDDLFRLPRNSIDKSTTMIQFRGKISQAVDRYERFKRIIGL